jgi:hypothetical protein
MKVQNQAEPSPPQRASVADELNKPRVKAAPRRFRWRAVIRSGGKLDPSVGGPSVAWHLAECATPGEIEAHCEIGRHLIALDGNPDGHCQVGDVCPRCDVAEEEAAAARAAEAAREAEAAKEAEAAETARAAEAAQQADATPPDGPESSPPEPEPHPASA